MSDAPGSMTAILDLLGSRVNLIGINSYTLSDGTAMLSGFAEPLSRDESPQQLAQALGKLPASLDAEVMEGKDGILVDTFHTGIKVGSDDYLMLRREGLARVFDHLVRLFGTGGEVLLYEEGKALGRDSAKRRVEEIGKERVVKNAGYIGRALTAQGWGTFATVSAPGSQGITITVADCFECAGGGKTRKKCDFLRGFLEASVEVTRGGGAMVEETECILRGGAACTFKIKVL